MGSKRPNETDEERVARKARKKEKKEKKSAKKAKKEAKISKDVDGAAPADTGPEVTTVVEGLPPTFYNADVNKVEEDQQEKQADDGNKNDDDDDDKADDDKADANTDDAAAAVATDSGDGPGTKKKRKRKRKRKVGKDDDDDDNDDDEENDNDNDNDGTAAAAQADAAMVQDTIFVEGIPFDVSPEAVREFFEKTHKISDVIELRLPTWQDSGRLRGFGHVRFGSKESYEKALTLSGKYLGRRYLTIQAANKLGGSGDGGASGNRSGRSVEDPTIKLPTDCCTIFVNNLPYTASEDDISEAVLKHAPSVTIADDGVRIARNSVNRQSKGFAYIDFISSKETQKLMKSAIKKNITIGGRIVRLDYDTGRIKGSYRNESGQFLNSSHEKN
jgi:nucleolin